MKLSVVWFYEIDFVAEMVSRSQIFYKSSISTTNGKFEFKYKKLIDKRKLNY
jgi:hypothetical protein